MEMSKVVGVCAATVVVSTALSVIADMARSPNATDESPGGPVNTTVGAEAESIAGSLDTTPSGLVISVQ